MRMRSLSFMLMVICLFGSGPLSAIEPPDASNDSAATGAGAMKETFAGEAAEAPSTPLASPLAHEPTAAVNTTLIVPPSGAVPYGEPGICPVITDIVADICAQSPTEPYCQQ